MKNEKRTGTLLILLAVVLIATVVSTIIRTVAYDAFNWFEVFYFVCILLALALALMPIKDGRHVAASVVVLAVGFFVNAYFWSFEIVNGIERVLNFVLCALIIAATLAFVHERQGADISKMVLLVCASLLAACIAVIVIFSIATNVDRANDTLLNASVIAQNVSLLAMVVIPVTYVNFDKLTALDE